MFIYESALLRPLEHTEPELMRTDPFAAREQNPFQVHTASTVLPLRPRRRLHTCTKWRQKEDAA